MSQIKVMRAIGSAVKEGPPFFVALGSRLRGVPEVLTLGVKPNFHDYTPHEIALISDADLVLYPTLLYAQFFTTIGKRIFPSLETYIYSDEGLSLSTIPRSWPTGGKARGGISRPTFFRRALSVSRESPGRS